MSRPCDQRVRHAMALIAVCPDELSLEAEAALVCRFFEDDDNPNAWAVRHVWASDADKPVFAVVLEAEGSSRAFTVAPQAGGYGVHRV